MMSSCAGRHAVQLPMQTSSAAPESSSCCLQSCLAAAVSCQACLAAEAKQASRTRRTGKAGSKPWNCSLIATVCLWKRWCASPRPLPWSRRKSLLSLRCAPSAYPLTYTFSDVGQYLLRAIATTNVDNSLGLSLLHPPCQEHWLSDQPGLLPVLLSLKHDQHTSTAATNGTSLSCTDALIS